MRSNSQRLTKTAVNMEASRPIDRVTAKPWIGPVPNWNRKSAAIRVVRLASMIDDSALSKPASIADAHRPAGAQLLADALEDQHVGVDRHADGEDDAGDAGQRQRGAEVRPGRRSRMSTFSTSASDRVEAGAGCR